ncbi:hypothetical protein MMO38_11615 [Acinetobacter sp. NIPH 1852]|uniref:hypothetical protein n=1 Tax=Acinetobacter sp. NIPH 1852 TaxID=2923428 RepID=UPI001F4AB100|nr:hypothetical protein [Acinetobacter sp. NIPH 1852]MCH7308775.1 hypothetical protein [Acinetobacter sp. NIPH 1852]
MYMANRVFELQYSRFAIVLQLFIFIIIICLLYRLLSIPLWLLSIVIMAVAWFVFQKKPQIQRFEYLDGQEWSFCFRHLPHSIQHRKIRQIIDHQCYIVIYFYDPLHPPCIIWWDQLSVSQWKNLKILAKLA